MATLHLISTPKFWSHSEEDRTSILVQNVFQLTQVYNGCLESSWSALPMEAALAASTIMPTPGNSYPNRASGSPTSIHGPNTNPNGGCGGTSTGASDGAAGGDKKSSPVSSSSSLQNRLRILVQINAANRNDTALLRLSLKPLAATRLLQIVARKRSTFASHSFSRVTISNFYSAPGEDVMSVDKFEPCFTDEDSKLHPLNKGFSQCPSLLGRAAVKKTENGDQRLSRSARNKMYSYFHEMLWTLVGEHSDDLILWGLHSNTIPLVLQPLDLFISLRNALSLGQHFQGE
jgi:hypothetical protein